MNFPFLILGYERSGTTMLRRLMSMHPKLPRDIIHEQQNLLFASKTLEEVRKSLPDIEIGQKIAYLDQKRVNKAIAKFKEYFEDFRLIHIVRDPVGAINSQLGTFKKKPEDCIVRYFNSVPYVIKTVSDIKNSYRVKYEDLIKDPMTYLDSIYRWMGEPVEEELMKRIISTKDRWEYNGKSMVGLRYNDRVGPTNREFQLNKNIIKSIEDNKSKYPELIFETGCNL